MINESEKGLNWSFIPSCHLPSTEEPILLGFSLLFTLAGLHLLLLPVTAIKISSRSAIMVSSCHCADKNGKVQHYWNVERKGSREDNTRTIITVWQKSSCSSVTPNKHALLPKQSVLSAEIYVMTMETKHQTLVSSGNFTNDLRKIKSTREQCVL